MSCRPSSDGVSDVPTINGKSPAIRSVFSLALMSIGGCKHQVGFNNVIIFGVYRNLPLCGLLPSMANSNQVAILQQGVHTWIERRTD